MKNFMTRTLSGAIYVAIIVGGILGGPLAFTALCCLLAGLAVYEFHKVAAPGEEFSLALTLTDLVGALVAVMGCCFSYADPATTVVSAKTWGLAFLLWYVVRMVVQLYVKGRKPLKDMGATFASLMWIAFPIAMMSTIYGTGSGKFIVLSMFIMIWLNDTGAYLVGCTIGKHRLFERISPKKSWEGFFGGLIFAIAGGYVMGNIWSLDPLKMAGMGLIVSIFATWGDLVESLVKRSLGIKDSGNIIPGHGGILDRIDSLLLVAPAVTLYFIALTLLG